MPLKKGNSPETRSVNIAELVRAGHPPKQAEAIAYRVAGEDCAALDMSPEEWDQLTKGWEKFLDEEREEPAHQAQDRLALDRGSVRTYDTDGRLRVAKAHLSKANVCEYLGSEIPDAEKLGLDPGKRYRLLRAPEELKKAAQSSNGIPLLIKHTPVSADDHRPDLVVGSVGTEAEFNDPYLDNALSVWAREGIDAIESGTQKELSCGYHYKADMTPGTFLGEPYHGVMRDIGFNHVALVPAGRAGSDVVVGDAALPEVKSKKEICMSKIVLTRKATLLGGAISAYLLPKLAQDARLDLAPILKGVTAKNFKAEKPKIVAAVTKATTGKLAQDASLEDLTDLLDHLETERVEEGADIEPNSGLPMSKEEMEKKTKEESEKKEADDRKARDAKRAMDRKARDEKMHGWLKDKGMSAEDLKAFDDLMGEIDGMDEESERAKENAEGEEKGGGEDRKGARDKEPMVSKSAMDAAIADASKKATQAALRTANEISAAREFVFPWTGKLAMDAVCAEDVYKAALEQRGVDVTDIHPSAFRKLLEAQPVPGSSRDRIAQDEAGSGHGTGFAKRFGEMTGHIVLAG